MNRTVWITLLLALSVSPPGTALDKEKILAAVAAKVEAKAQKQSSSNQSDASESKVIADRVRPNELTDTRSESYRHADNNLNVASCPFGTAGTPTYDSFRYQYRDHTDAELWKLCLNRNKLTSDGNAGACACALLASPDPWRPVDTPHNLELAAEPIADPGPAVSEK